MRSLPALASPLRAGPFSRRLAGPTFTTRIFDAKDNGNKQNIQKVSQDKDGPARRREKGPAPLGVGSERTSSRWTQIAKQNCTAGEPGRAWELVLRTAPRRGRDLAQRGEAQGGQQGTRSSEAKGRVPDMCNGGPYPA